MRPSAATPKLSDASLRRFYSKIDISPVRNECWVWTAALDSHGYGQIGVDRKLWLAHRLMYALTRGRLPPVVMHTCDTPECVNPLHLQAGTALLNSQDKHAKGRANVPRGADHARARLTEEQVRWAVANFGALSDREISEELGVAPVTINHIRRNRTWRHVPRKTE